MQTPPDFQRIHDELLKLPTPDLLGFIPYRRGEPDALVRREEFSAPARCEQGLAVPPAHLRVSVDYGTTDADYLRIGKEHVATMKAIVARHGFTFPPGARVLEFGCSTGRMIRWLLPEASRCSILGADISAEAVYWAQEHLSPPFSFFTSTLAPHLPFRDATLDLIYAGSVFTHIDDLAESWLGELARILKPGGLAYLTIHDEAAIENLLGVHRGAFFAGFLEKKPNWPRFRTADFSRFTLGRFARSQVFYRRATFEKIAAPWFRTLSFEAGAYLYQTAALLAAR